jgi:hypothetical protein
VAFLAAPLLSDPDKLRLDHISAPLALIIEGPFQVAAIALLTPGRTPEEANNIRSAGEPHIRPRPTHPLTTATPVRDTFLAVICMEYNTKENTEGGCLAFLDFVVQSI